MRLRAAAYNQGDGKREMRIHRAIGLLLLAAAIAGTAAWAQTGSATAATAGAATMPAMRPIVLVFPFDNLTDATRTMPAAMQPGKQTQVTPGAADAAD